MQRARKHANRGDRVLDGRELLRCVATTVLAAREDHRHLGDLRHVLGVVSGAAVHAAVGDALFPRRPFEGRDHARVARAGGQVERLRPGDPQAAALGDLAHQSLLLRVLGLDRPLFGVARVERERHLVRDGRGQVRLHVDASDRRHRRRAALQRDADDGADDLREPGHRVETAAHRARTGVIGAPDELDDVVRDRGDRVDHADRQPLVLEDRPLLDVQLDPGADVVARGLGDLPRVEADRLHRLADRQAVVLVDSLGVVRPDRADDRARAPEVGRVKAARLLLAERHRLERAPRLAELLAQSPEGDDPRDHAERSVVPAAGVLRVDVRAGRDDGTRFGSGEAAPRRSRPRRSALPARRPRATRSPGSGHRPIRASRPRATLRSPRARRAGPGRRCTARRARDRCRWSRRYSRATIDR